MPFSRVVRMISKAKTSRVNRATRSAPSSDASAYCGDLDNDQKSLDAGFLCVALHQSGYII